MEVLDITQNPPSLEQLKAAVASGEYSLKQLFNTSGELYRGMDLKSKLPGMSDQECYKLLSLNGKLIKRPFITNAQWYIIGFDEKKLRKLAVR